jgi:hypothetical protein
MQRSATDGISEGRLIAVMGAPSAQFSVLDDPASAFRFLARVKRIHASRSIGLFAMAFIVRCVCFASRSSESISHLSVASFIRVPCSNDCRDALITPSCWLFIQHRCMVRLMVRYRYEPKDKGRICITDVWHTCLAYIDCVQGGHPRGLRRSVQRLPARRVGA